MNDPAVLELIRAEVGEAIDPLTRAFGVLGRERPETAVHREAVEQARLHVECIRAGAEAGGLPGLELVCDRFLDNLVAMPGLREDRRTRVDALLTLWPERVMAYLTDPGEPSMATALADVLRDEAWPQPLNAEEADLLIPLLAEGMGGQTGVSDPDDPVRPTTATEDDVRLTPSEDVNMDVFSAFLDDAPQQTAELSAMLSALSGTGDPSPVLDQARRIAHTLKGAAGVAGVKGVMNLTHHLEDLLDGLAASGGRPGTGLTRVLGEVADCLEAMVDALTGADTPPENARSILQVLLDLANGMDRGEPLDADTDPLAEVLSAPVGGGHTERGSADPADQAAVTGDEMYGGRPGAGPMEQSLRVPMETVDTLFRYTGELSVASAQMDERINRILRMQQAFVEQDRVIQQRLLELEDLIDIRDVVSARYSGRAQPMPEASDGGQSSGFDPLEMDAYNELHGVGRMLSEAIADWRELNASMHDQLLGLRGAANQQGRLHRALEDTVLSTRLVSVRSVSGRLQRSVRQACRATARQAELRLHGENLHLDTELLQALMDPLGHLLRNAVDHGIESPEERLRAGKPETGVISLTFRRDGSMIEVLCEDDGRGLDLDAVRRRAVELGVLSDDAQPDHEHLFRTILLPGFSTRESVTRLSGRGVGLDVVHERVRALQGTMDVRSKAGSGSRFVLRVPVALVTLYVLLVESGGQTVAIPSSDLQQVPVPGTGRRTMSDGTPVFGLDDAEYPVRSLASLMGRPVGRPGEPGRSRPLLLAAPDGAPLALEVDRLLGGADVVIKGFGENLPRVPGVLGAAILGDGTVAPVLDLAALNRASALMEAGVLPTAADVTEPDEQIDVMVVDDSLSVRRSLSGMLRDAGFQVRLARDGIEAVRAVDERRPDLMLVDLEMPRMNGLELTAHLRQRDDTRSLPIVMVTSRSMQKHRRQAEASGVNAYLTKPFQEQALLSCIEEQLTGAEAP